MPNKITGELLAEKMGLKIYASFKKPKKSGCNVGSPPLRIILFIIYFFEKKSKLFLKLSRERSGISESL